MKKLKQLLLLAVIAFAFSFVVKADTQAAQIVNVKQTDAGDSYIDLSWGTDLAAEKYSVELSHDNKTWVEKDSTTRSSSTIYNLSAGASYYVRVTSYKEDGTVSSTASAPIEAVTAPSASGFTAAQAGASTSTVKILGSKVSGANYYFVTLNDKIVAASASNLISLAKLSAGTQYWVRVYPARKASTGFVAYGKYSYEYMWVKTVSNKINTKNFGVSNIWANLNSYRFAISNASAVDGYQFQFLTMKGAVKKTVTTTSSYTTVDNFINGNFYKYRVRSYVNCGSSKACSAWSGYRYIGMSKKFSGNSRNGRIKVSWSKVNSASSYAVYISTKPTSGYKKVKTLSAKKRSLSIKKYGKKKLKKGKTYYVRVIAQAKSGKKTVKSGVNWRGMVTVR